MSSQFIQNHHTFYADFYTLRQYGLRIRNQCNSIGIAVIFTAHTLRRATLFPQGFCLKYELTSKKKKQRRLTIINRVLISMNNRTTPKTWGGHLILCPPPSKSWGGRVPPVPPGISALTPSTSLQYTYQKHTCVFVWIACPSPDGKRHDDSCYTFKNEKLTQENANETCCQSHGSHLVYIGSTEEESFLFDNIPSGWYDGSWIGLIKDPATTSRLIWMNNSTLNYTPTAGIIQNAQNKNCFRLGFNNKWKETSCDWHLNFICENEMGKSKFD